MYIVQAKFSNGGIEFVGKYENRETAEEKKKKAEPYYVDYGGTVEVVEA